MKKIFFCSSILLYNRLSGATFSEWLISIVLYVLCIHAFFSFFFFRYIGTVIVTEYILSIRAYYTYIYMYRLCLPGDTVFLSSTVNVRSSHLKITLHSVNYHKVYNIGRYTVLAQLQWEVSFSGLRNISTIIL